MRDQERRQPGEEEIRRQHEEDVAKKRERERRDEPRRRVTEGRIGEQGEECRRFRDVLERANAARHREPVEKREHAEGDERHRIHIYIWRRTPRAAVPVARAIAAA